MGILSFKVDTQILTSLFMEYILKIILKMKNITRTNFKVYSSCVTLTNFNDFIDISLHIRLLCSFAGAFNVVNMMLSLVVISDTLFFNICISLWTKPVQVLRLFLCIQLWSDLYFIMNNVHGLASKACTEMGI